ncbi:MAG: Na+/H+ antiporter NhaA [Sphingobacteriaceae bacterium]
MAKLINLKPFREFFQSGQLGGILLIFCVIISLILANSTWGPSFNKLLNTEWGFEWRSVQLIYSNSLWINDALMAVFFLLVGLEIKRELLEGELSSIKKAAMPVFAALGGMLMPAAIYTLFNYGRETGHGWGIPMATDIAFALAIISLLGKKVPASLKIFLAALAIVDDLGAILVIAIFYTSELHLDYLAYSAGIIALLAAFNYFGVKKLIFYIIPGIFLWYFVHHSGIHATIAGVLLAFCIPTNPVKETSPLEKLEHIILKPVNFFIMPLFALANTNIHLESEMLNGLLSPLGLGIITGLVLGKPLGVMLFSWISVKLGWSTLPSQANWKHILGLGMLAGIGFTMSIFVSLLSFKEATLQTEAKFCILVASILASFIGYQFLNMLNKRKTA